MNDHEKQQVLKTCERFLGGNYPQTPKQQLSELAAYTNPEEEADRYGEGELITAFEAEVAYLLGKEAAVFMPSGTMCQQIALRIWTDRRKLSRVAFHPTCHLEIHEQQGYRKLHNLDSVLVGQAQRMLTLADLESIAEPLGALLLELPQREIGGQLPTWEDLKAVVAWAHAKGIAVHLDGARLWECKPFYQHEYAEIAGLFDSVYVSFYKILGGIAGSMLTGPADFIAEARVWQRRHGGNLFHLYPFVLAARKGLHERLGKMALYHTKAREIAEVLSTFSRIQILPDPPQTNMMHVFLQGDAEKLLEASLNVARETNTLLFSYLTPTIVPHWSSFELTIGDAALDLKNDDIARLFSQLFASVENAR